MLLATDCFVSFFSSIKAPPSDPLWKVRITQGLNKCLEKLRKENEIVVAKTAMEILLTIFRYNLNSY